MKEDLLFFVAPVNDRPVVILPVQITHLHTWRTYQDDLSRVIVSVDEVDTLEDTPISFEGTSKIETMKNVDNCVHYTSCNYRKNDFYSLIFLLMSSL